MPPGGGRVGEDGCTEQSSPPATGPRDMYAPSHSPPPFPSSDLSSSEKKLDDEQREEKDLHQSAASLPEGTLVEILSRVHRGWAGEYGCTEQSSPPAIRPRGRDTDAPSHSPPPSPSPETSSSEEKLEDEQHQEDQHQPAANLPEGALVEILSRVPYRSLCRFKCVSKPWLALCSATDIRRRSPQTLSGFFHLDIDGLQFRNLAGRGPPMVDPSLPFLRKSYKYIVVKQCCSSLLLCQCWKSTPEGDACDYIVCNPATEKWTVLPRTVLLDEVDVHLVDLDQDNIFLGFDTAAPSRFVVFALMSRYCNRSAKLAIYSSQTGQWTSVQSGWDNNNTMLVGNHECVFLNGIMHLATYHSSVATVDSEGKVWRKIEIPRLMPSSGYDALISIGQSQGCLHAWRIDYHQDCQLYVWVLEDYENGKWSLKHSVNVSELFRRHGRTDVESCTMFAIHPECNLIFLTNGKETTLSYDMDSQNVHVICTSGDFFGGLPYTPCFAEWR